MEVKEAIRLATIAALSLVANLFPLYHVSACSNLSDSRTFIKAQAGANLNNGAPQCKDKPGEVRAGNEVEEIRFGFDPTDPTRESISHSVYMVLSRNGDAHVLLYDRYGSAVTAAYKGVLPRTETAQLLTRVRKAIEEAAKPHADPTVIRESDLFSLSLKLKGGAVEGVSRKVADMPATVRTLIGNLQVLWQKLKKVAPADGYLRSSRIEEERLALLLKEGRLRFTPVREFPQDLQPTLRRAVEQPADFHPLSLPRMELLKNYAIFGELFVVDEDAGYQMTFFLSKPVPTGTSKERTK